MATVRAETAGSPGTGASGGGYGGYPQGDTGWLLFAGIMIAAVGILNVIYGIAAIGNSSFFVGDARYILSDLNTWGWVMLVLGSLQVIAALSIWAGRVCSDHHSASPRLSKSLRSASEAITPPASVTTTV